MGAAPSPAFGTSVGLERRHHAPSALVAWLPGSPRRGGILTHARRPAPCRI